MLPRYINLSSSCAFESCRLALANQKGRFLWIFLQMNQFFSLYSYLLLTFLTAPKRRSAYSQVNRCGYQGFEWWVEIAYRVNHITREGNCQGPFKTYLGSKLVSLTRMKRFLIAKWTKKLYGTTKRSEAISMRHFSNQSPNFWIARVGTKRQEIMRAP